MSTKNKKTHGLGKGIGSLLGNYTYDVKSEEILDELNRISREAEERRAAESVAEPEPAPVEEPKPAATIVLEKTNDFVDPEASVKVKVKEKKEKEGKSLDKAVEKTVDTLTVAPAVKGDAVRDVPIDDVRPNPNQPRKSFDETSLQELAESIARQGVLQPLLVEEIAPGQYSIIAGERRWRAAKLAGVDKVPVLVKQFSEVQKIEVALIENIQRENLNPVDEAFAYQFLIQKSGLTQEDVAKRVGKNRSTITNSLRLLQLPDSMKDDLVAGVITPGHARAILSCVNPSDRILLRNRIVEKELSVRAAEREAEALNQGKKLILRKKGSDKERDPEVQDVEDKLLEAFGTKVELKGNLKKGKLIIPFRSRAELERLYSLVGEDELFSET